MMLFHWSLLSQRRCQLQICIVSFLQGMKVIMRYQHPKSNTQHADLKPMINVKSF